MPKTDPNADKAALEARLEVLAPSLVALAEAAVRLMTDLRKNRAEIAIVSEKEDPVPGSGFYKETYTLRIIRPRPHGGDEGAAFD